MTASPLALGCIFLASGQSRRMGRNKLLLPWQGFPLLSGLLRRWPRELFAQLLVVTPQGVLSELATRQGFTVVAGDETLQSRSIALGVAALGENLDGCLFSVCDQPLLSLNTVKKLVETFEHHRHSIVAPCWKGRRGNPVIFPAHLLSQLATLEGDRGGRSLLEAHKEEVILVEVESEEELFDLDNPDDLKELSSKAGLSQNTETPLWSALELSLDRPVSIALVGGGGKTTLLWALAHQAWQAGRTVAVTTTTHMRPLSALPVLNGNSQADLVEELARCGIVQTGFMTEEGKLHSSFEVVQFCRSVANVVLVEADGSRGLPLKAPASHEPQIPPQCDIIVALAGADALGAPLSQVCHRPELAAQLLDCHPDAPITPALMASLLTHEKGGRKGLSQQAQFRVVINKEDLNTQGAGEVVQNLKEQGVKTLSTSFLPRERDGQCWS